MRTARSFEHAMCCIQLLCKTFLQVAMQSTWPCDCNLPMPLPGAAPYMSDAANIAPPGAVRSAVAAVCYQRLGRSHCFVSSYVPSIILHAGATRTTRGVLPVKSDAVPSLRAKETRSFHKLTFGPGEATC